MMIRTRTTKRTQPRATKLQATSPQTQRLQPYESVDRSSSTRLAFQYEGNHMQGYNKPPEKSLLPRAYLQCTCRHSSWTLSDSRELQLTRYLYDIERTSIITRYL
ncbi:hypothetical protein VTK56DRAFT_6659 [Thermocarpiscus australiensis]